jgi:conjugative relaxase-like TrwC/TraI family protein
MSVCTDLGHEYATRHVAEDGWLLVEGTLVLNIGKLAAGKASYYLSLASGVEDYYTGQGEAPGRWFGAGADRLGLSGTVGSEDLRMILAGRAPCTGEQLTGARMPGFDLTFRAPKTVSLLYALGDTDTVTGEVVAAHEAAVEAAVGYLERAACSTRRRVNGDIAGFAGKGLVAAGFRHQTSRAGDPTLHTHVLVANMTRTPDGRWGALDGRQLYVHAKTAGYLYQAHLRAELTRRLGAEWRPVINGCADIAGIPGALVAEFSTRRLEIVERMEQRGQFSAKAAQAAALDTRRAKDYHVDAGELRVDWANRADGLGFGPDRVAGLVSTGVRREPDLTRVGHVLVDLASEDGLTKHASTFGRADVLRGLAEAFPEGADVSVIEDLAGEFLARSNPVPVGIVKGQQAWTTRELLEVERRLLAGVGARRWESTAVAERAYVAAALGARASISDEQADMVTGLCLAGRGVDVVVGAAGTGKTFALAAARNAWEQSGFCVYGAALSARAAAELEDGSGIPSTTITRLLGQIDSGRVRLDARSVVVVDEAGMVGTRTLDRLHRATAVVGAKLVLVGDPAQLPEIEAGGAFRALTERHDPIRLVENRRQIHHWERTTLDHLRDGRVDTAVGAYRRRDRIVVAENLDDMRDRVVDDWFGSHQSGEMALMIAAHREEVADLNHRARLRLTAAGLLGETRLRAGGREFAVGDRVMAVGRNHYDLDILNGDLGTITGFGPTGDITFRSDRTSTTRTMPGELVAEGLLDHGYARTNHKAQGATVDRCFILGDDGDLDHQAGYAALSRGRLENRLYILQPDPGLDGSSAELGVEDHVTGELSRDRSQQLASDIFDKLDRRIATRSRPPQPPDRELARERDHPAPAVEPPDLGIDIW